MQIIQVKELQQKCTDEIIDWLHECWEITERNGLLQPDPFYERNEKLTPEVVTKIIRCVEDLMIKEFKNYPGYHNNAQGVDVSHGEILVPTGFDKMPYPQQLAIAQGVDKVFQNYKPAPAPAYVPKVPEPTGDPSSDLS